MHGLFKFMRTLFPCRLQNLVFVSNNVNCSSFMMNVHYIFSYLKFGLSSLDMRAMLYSYVISSKYRLSWLKVNDTPLVIEVN